MTVYLHYGPNGAYTSDSPVPNDPSTVPGGPGTATPPLGPVYMHYGPNGAYTDTNPNGAVGTPPPANPTPAQPVSVVTTDPSTQTTDTSPDAIRRELEATFPWLKSLGLDIAFFQNLEAETTSPDEKLARIRNTNQYKQRFVAITRADGSLRMNEREYLDTEVQYRKLLTSYGFGDQYADDDPGSLRAIFESDQDPTELRDRLQTYTNLKEAGQETIDAFYVYAGMRITVDDLYEATVDPSRRQSLVSEYTNSAGRSTGDYQTYITRATELGMQKAAEQLTGMAQAGTIPAAGLQAHMATNPEFARQFMDILATGGGQVTEPMPLNELLATFEYAALGAAARGAGLELPDKARIMEIRAAGIDRARARQAYQQYGVRASSINEAAQRAQRGVFGQNEFEQSAFLGNASKQADLEFALSMEEASGKDQGGFQFGQDRAGRFTQEGLRTA